MGTHLRRQPVCGKVEHMAMIPLESSGPCYDVCQFLPILPKIWQCVCLSLNSVPQSHLQHDQVGAGWGGLVGGGFQLTSSADMMVARELHCVHSIARVAANAEALSEPAHQVELVGLRCLECRQPQENGCTLIVLKSVRKVKSADFVFGGDHQTKHQEPETRNLTRNLLLAH